MSGYSSTPDSTASIAFAVTPSDAADLAMPAKALYIGGSGNVVGIPEDSAASVTFTGVVAGSVLPVRFKRVLATGTTATGLVGLV